MDKLNDQKGSELVLRSARARQQYWIEERDRTRAAGDDQAAGNAQRFVDEYDAFVSMILQQVGRRQSGA